jgi:hypothetical protein
MITTVIMLSVSGAIYRLLLTSQRLTRAQAEQLGVQSNVRGALLVVVNELRELGVVPGGSGAQNDILSIAPSAITYRAMRGLGIVCQRPSATEIRISRDGFSGHRDPQAGRDSIYLFVGRPQADPQSAWIPLAITNVSTATPCAGTAGPAITLAVSPAPSIGEAAPGMPVRTYELMQVRLYQADGKSWLGMRSVSAGEAIQPLFGPLAEINGFRLDYFDGRGMPTNTPSAIQSIGVTVHGVGEGTSILKGMEGKPAEEELATRVGLRNAVR